MSSNGNPSLSKQEVLQRLQQAESKLKAQAKPKHTDLLNHLLAQVVDVNFAKAAGKADEESVEYDALCVLVCREVSRPAKSNCWQLCQREGFFWLYNGCFWKKITEAEIEAFLGKASEKMGVNNIKAETYTFREKVRKQFSVSGYLPEPPMENIGIKVNLQNGTLHIYETNVELKPFDPLDFLRYQLPFEYNPTATAQRWHSFLEEVLPDTSLQNLLCEMIAYVFIPSESLKLEKCLFLYGSGANGKSVVFEVISALLGKENVSNYSINSLTDRSGYYRSELAGKLVNYTSEIGSELESDIFKLLASGEPVEARLPYRDPQIIRNYAKMIFNANRLPDVPEFTHGFFRRFVIIPFEVTIPEEKQDRDLPQKIIASELPGVLNWLLTGLGRLTTQRKLSFSEKADSQVKTFRTESDSVSLFLTERMEDGYLEKDINGCITVSYLYADFSSWVVTNGYKRMSKKSFTSRMKGLGYESGHNSDRTARAYLGIKEKTK